MCPHLFGRNISNWTEKSFAFNVAAVHSRPKYAYRPQTRARAGRGDDLYTFDLRLQRRRKSNHRGKPGRKQETAGEERVSGTKARHEYLPGLRLPTR